MEHSCTQVPVDLNHYLNHEFTQGNPAAIINPLNHPAVSNLSNSLNQVPSISQTSSSPASGTVMTHGTDNTQDDTDTGSPKYVIDHGSNHPEALKDLSDSYRKLLQIDSHSWDNYLYGFSPIWLPQYFSRRRLYLHIAQSDAEMLKGEVQEDVTLHLYMDIFFATITAGAVIYIEKSISIDSDVWTWENTIMSTAFHLVVIIQIFSAATMVVYLDR